MPILSAIVFENPKGLWLALPALAVVVFSVWKLGGLKIPNPKSAGTSGWPTGSGAAVSAKRSFLPGWRVVLLTLLRGVALAALVLLVARPVWVVRERPNAAARSVVVLMDRSESMSLEDNNRSRYDLALDLLRSQLLPELRSAALPVQAMLFDQVAEPADGDTLRATKPKGRRTNLAGAIATAIGNAAQPPLAVVALTDGVFNEDADNNRGLTELVDAQVPFIGVGFGSDRGVRTLSLRELDAPTTVPTKTGFRISAQLEMINADDIPGFELLLFRDGLLQKKKTVQPGKGSRTWLENFQTTEDKEGVHNYTVQLMAPDVPNLKCVNTMASTAVRVSDQKELRVLYIQGSLTWDYKFITLALRDDSTIKMTGLTRTSKQSVFRQNVESSGELLNGFPSTLEELAPFRVIVLSNVRPTDLTAPQQEVLAKFCGELGGGVLMIGGPATFDHSWRNTRLEQLLPVVFSGGFTVQGLDRPFRLQLTEDALQHPVFQVADNRPMREVWAQVPTFSQYGRVDSGKPGAQIWALHESEDGPQGRRILMASQRYGAGLSAVICLQNFWRWRLAKDGEPQQFDRFWRQMFRFLSEAGRQDVSIHLADQDLRPQMDVQVILEKQPNPKNLVDTNKKYFARVEDSKKNVLLEQAVELEPLRPVDFRFRAEKPDVYTVFVTDPLKVPLASRPIEIRDVNVEFQATARDMESLRQWAAISDGLAVKAEECGDTKALVSEIKTKIEQVRLAKQWRRPVGINVWTLSLLLGCLGGEWLLRKRWGFR